ncbi:MAG: CsbD family protein [Pirellulales bacterium]
MVDQQVLKGQWQEVRGKLKERWGQLTDDDVRTFEGTTDSLIGRIQQRTGETRQAIEGYLEELTDDGALRRARESVEAMASRVAESAQDGYDRVEEMVHDRPGQSLLVAFGVGIVAGIGLTMLVSSGSAPRRSQSEALGRQLLDALQGLVPDSFRGR